ncbi:MAG: hypothetical protein AABZ67_05195 [Pseudomonadota bacterium]
MNRFTILSVLLIAFSASAWAQETIGFVKTVSGDALLIDAGKYVIAKVGAPVKSGNVLKTGANGTMGVTFKDNTVMSFGPDTELTLDEYLYAPGKGDLKFGASMSKGTLQVVSGVIARLKPESAVLKTPAGIIAMRNAHFLVKIDQ